MYHFDDDITNPMLTSLIPCSMFLISSHSNAAINGCILPAMFNNKRKYSTIQYESVLKATGEPVQLVNKVLHIFTPLHT